MGIVVKQDKSPSLMKHAAFAGSGNNIALKRTTDGEFSQDIPSDVTVKACGVPFALHKFPLVSRSGWIRKLVAQIKDSGLSRIVDFHDIPGGAEAFELAAKFCYGIKIEINATNVAMLRCAAEYLEMSEDYGEGNLISRTEAYLKDLVNANLSTSVKVLQNCKDLLPMAEELNIVSRCIEAAATRACKEQIASNLSGSQKSKSRDWWAEELSVLRIDFYQRVLSAMRARGLRYDNLGSAIVHYAQRALQGLITKPSPIVRIKCQVHDTSIAMEHEQRVLVETIISLLPPERNTASVSFLFGLVRAAIYLDTTVACRLDLERRIGLQLEQASLDDLLIPSFSYTNDTLFDVDTIYRIVKNFLHQDDFDDVCDPLVLCKLDHGGSPSPSSVLKVARLLDCYLAEIAPDVNLSVAKFVGLGELLPEYARVVDDGLYRAIDIYLKAHPLVNELERKKICSLMDCQKLSQEACAHAAQNERLSIQVVVQVLYCEQMKLRNALRATATGAGGGGCMEYTTGQEGELSQRIISSGEASAAESPREEYQYVAIRRENMELKLEVARMKTRMSDMEVEQANQKQQQQGLSKSKLLQAVSKKLGKLNPFQRRNNNPKDSRTPDSRVSRRRHSIS